MPYLLVFNKELVNNGHGKKCSFIYFSFDGERGKLFLFYFIIILFNLKHLSNQLFF